MSNEAPQEDNGIPRGALIVVAVGLLACLAAAALATDKSSGAAANLEWVKTARIPDSKVIEVPGGAGEMRLEKGQIAATGTNVSGYSLFRAATTLRIDGGSPVGDAQILCVTKGGPRAEIARSSGGLRALYPRSADNGIYSQSVPEVLLLDFSARGGELVVVEAEDLLIPGFTSEKGVKLEWPEYTEGVERLKYFVAGGKPANDLVLPFYSVWKSTAVPSAEISCTVKTSAGKSTASIAGGLEKMPPPIDEEAEDEAEEQAEEEADELEEDEAEGDE